MSSGILWESLFNLISPKYTHIDRGYLNIFRDTNKKCSRLPEYVEITRGFTLLETHTAALGSMTASKTLINLRKGLCKGYNFGKSQNRDFLSCKGIYLSKQEGYIEGTGNCRTLKKGK